MSSTNAQGYSSFYQHLAVSPELGIFRRFGAYWAKKVHDETSDLSTCLAVLNLELAKWPDLQAQTILDCPKRLMMEKCPKDTAGGKYLHLHEAWDRFDKALMVYGETLCMSERIMNMPTQDEFNTKKLLKWELPYHKPLFEKTKFVLTGEKAGTYQGDAARKDTCTWREPKYGDFLSKHFLDACPWIEERILVRWRNIFHSIQPTDAQLPSTMQYDHIVKTMDLLTSVLVSILLAITVVVLKIVSPIAIRIALIGIFGTLFALLRQLMTGTPRRGEIFGATAAFYAVAVVFVGTTSNSPCD